MIDITPFKPNDFTQMETDLKLDTIGTYDVFQLLKLLETENFTKCFSINKEDSTVLAGYIDVSVRNLARLFKKLLFIVHDTEHIDALVIKDFNLFKIICKCKYNFSDEDITELKQLAANAGFELNYNGDLVFCAIYRGISAITLHAFGYQYLVLDFLEAFNEYEADR